MKPSKNKEGESNPYLDKHNKKQIRRIDNSQDFSNENIIPVSIKEEDIESIEFILMDFKVFENLSKYSNLKQLTLIQQAINSIEVIIKLIFKYILISYLFHY